MRRHLGMWFFGLIQIASLGLLMAQTSSLRFEQLSTRSGLSQVNVSDLLQDRQGYLWATTEDGLNRFDGYRFQVFRHKEDNPTSIRENYVWCLLEDPDGFIYMGTNTGLDRYNPIQENFERIELEGLQESIRVRNLCQDEAGNLWIGTHLGLFIMPPKSQSARPLAKSNIPTLAIKEIRVMLLDQQQRMLVGTSNGLHRFDPKTKNWSSFRHDPHRPDSLSHNDIRELMITSDGTLWVGTLVGLNRQIKDDSFQRFRHVPEDPDSLGSNQITCLFEDSSHMIWVGTRKSLDRLTPTGFEHFTHDPTNPFSLGDSTVNCMLEDLSGNLWFGTDIGGLSIHKKAATKFQNITKDSNPNSLCFPSVRAFLLDSHEILWVGTLQGLNRFDPKINGFVHYHPIGHQPTSLVADELNALTEDHEGNVWIGTQGGLSKYNRSTDDFLNFRNDPADPRSLSHDLIRTLFVDEAGTLWIGTQIGGLNKFEPETGTFTHYRHQNGDPSSLSDDYVRAILEDQIGRFWLGMGLGGLNLMDRETGCFTHYRHRHGDPTSLSHDSVKVVMEDTRGRIWLGTHGGLNLFDPNTGKFKSWRENQGLVNDSVYGILEDDRGYLWLSTNAGLSQFDPATESFRNYDVRHGLQSNEFNSGGFYRDSRGKLYFGGVEGYNTFVPTGTEESHFSPPVVLTNFLIANREVPLRRFDPSSPLEFSIGFTKRITLDHQRNMFSFEFSALDYTVPDKNRYAYALEGYDDNWIETNASNRRATYTNLPGGSYVFKVKGSNHDGIWSKEQASLKLVIQPPPWRTWWAWLFYLTVSLGLVFGYLRQQKEKLAHERQIASQQRQLAEQERELAARLERMVDERTFELEERNKELETLDRVVQVINRETKVDNILLTILTEALFLAPNAEKGIFVLRQRYGQRLNVVTSFGYAPKQMDSFDLDIDVLAMRYKFGSEGPVKGIYRLEPGPDIPFNEILGSLAQALSVIALEIKLDGRLEGFLILDNMTQKLAFTDADVYKLARFRDHAVITLGKARVLQDLLEAQRELMTAAHEAGMAEIATEVLHNVGNLLNSVKTSGHLLRDAVLSHEFLVPLDKARSFLDTGLEITQDKRALLIRCIQKCEELFSKQQLTVSNESERMSGGLTAIFHLLSEQRRLTHPHRKLREETELNRIIEETAQGCFTSEQKVKVVFDLNQLPPLRVEALKLRRVVFFLLDNALTSVAVKQYADAQIRVTSMKQGDGISLCVTDNGVGIGAEDAHEIFSQNLNRASKNRWYGLHYCANTVKEMSGRIEASKTDEGIHTVTVWIPLYPGEPPDTVEEPTW